MREERVNVSQFGDRVHIAMPKCRDWAELDKAEVRRLVRELRHAAGMPKVITLCGSTRYRADFERAQRAWTAAGYIVLTVGWFAHDETGKHKEDVIGEEAAAQLDELHKQKIDLSDEVLVINTNGYAGASTAGEIRYAFETGVKVSVLNEKAHNGPSSHPQSNFPTCSRPATCAICIAREASGWRWEA
jgi:hypothetical protein